MTNDDSLSLLGFHPANQLLKIENRGDIKTVASIEFMKQEVEASGRTIDVLTTVVTEAKCIRSNSDGSLIYSVYGIGLTDPPHEFFGLLSEEGKWLWYYYGNQYDTYSQHGNKDSLISIFGKENINGMTGMTSLLYLL